MNQFICERGLGYLSWDIIPSCVISNDFWWFETLKHSFVLQFYLLCKCFGFLCLGLDSCVVASESVFWIIKSLASCFCVTTRLELFNTKSFWFYIVCVLCMKVWVNNKCCAVCFDLCITSWYLQEFCSCCKYHKAKSLEMKVA